MKQVTVMWPRPLNTVTIESLLRGSTGIAPVGSPEAAERIAKVKQMMRKKERGAVLREIVQQEHEGRKA